MVVRAGIVFLALVLISGACVAAPQNGARTLRSQRRSLSVSLTAPPRWGTPTYQAAPTYDYFSFSHGEEPAACYLQVRFDPYREEPGDRHSVDDIAIHWNTTPFAKIREQYQREFQRPRVEHIATLRVGGQPVRFHAVHNADGHFYAADIRRGDTVISLELRSPSRRELQRHKPEFLSVVRSLRTT